MKVRSTGVAGVQDGEGRRENIEVRIQDTEVRSQEWGRLTDNWH
jgi:hypothetical protein